MPVALSDATNVRQRARDDDCAV